MAKNQPIYFLNQSNRLENIKLNLNNLDYYATYNIEESLYLFKKDQIIKKFEIHADNKILLGKYGFSRNGDFFYFLNVEEGYLILIELKSKKEFSIQQKEKYDKIKVNQFVVLQSSPCYIDFLNFQTNNQIRFELEQNELELSEISNNNQYVISEQNQPYCVYLIQYNGNKLSILHKFNPFQKGFETSSIYNLLSQTLFMNLQYYTCLGRLYHMNNFKLIRKFYITPQAQNQGLGTQTTLQFFSTNALRKQSFFNEINLETGQITKLFINKWRGVTTQFKLIDQVTKDKMSGLMQIASQIINQPMGDYFKGLVNKFQGDEISINL